MISAVLVAATVLDTGAAAGPVGYRVEIGREARVRIEIQVPPASSACPSTFVMPRAIPMGYGEQPYDRFVTGLRAFDKDGALEVKRVEGPRWTLCSAGQSLHRLEYEVDLARMEEAVLSASDASKWRDGYVSLLGYSIFGFVEGLESMPISLEVRAAPDWPVFSTLAPSVPPARGQTSASAADFYTLADAQIIAGPRAQWRTLRTAPTRVFLALYSEAEGAVDIDLLGRLAAEAEGAVAAYFGSRPFDHYTLQQEYLRPRSEAHRYGMSMEHLESATFYLAADQALRSAADETARARILYNFAHHIAHAWIPKRCAGPGYFPFPWELAPLLDSIWFGEGFGQYAAIDALAARLPPQEAAVYRDRLVQRRFRESLAEAPAFLLRMPLVELSYVASTRYGEDFRTGRTVFARGGLMAAEMDEEIRRATGGQKSLRDALRALVAWSARERRPFQIADLPDHFRRATGVDVRKIHDRWLAPVAPR